MARVLIFVLSVLPFAAQAGANILVMGDSLSAAYGIPKSQGWVSLLQQRLDDLAYPLTVVNASISGETTEGGLRRLPSALDRVKPQLVLIELGANDGLRAQNLQHMRENLEQMIDLSRAAGADVVLFEMRIPPNYGARYSNAFRDSFHQIAQAADVVLVPFFLSAIAMDAAHFQDDGIHPTAAAQPQLLDAVWNEIETLLGPEPEQAAAASR